MSLQPAFLETLSEGDHTVTALFDDGASEATFKTSGVPIIKYTVTFDANGHGTAPAAQEVEDGKAASKPADPTADGWTFGGWYTDKACTKAYDFNTPVTSDLTLYAKWTKKTASSPVASKSSTSSAAPKTGDTAGGIVTALALTAGLALCVALLTLYMRPRRSSAQQDDRRLD